MIIKDCRDAILALLTTDATFVAAVAALIGVPVTSVVKTNRPPGEVPIPAGEKGCWVIELGDSKASSINNDGDYIQTIGLSQQTFQKDFYVVLVWQENDRDRAGDTRAELPVLLTQLFLRNPQPGGVDGAMVTGDEPDRGVLHPTQVWRATIQTDMTFYRD